MGEPQESNNFRLEHPTWINEAQRQVRAHQAIARNKALKGERLRVAETRPLDQFQLLNYVESIPTRVKITRDEQIELIHKMLIYNQSHPHAPKSYDDFVAEWHEEQQKKQKPSQPSGV